MGSIPTELKLDYRPSYVPKIITDVVKEVSLIRNVSDKVSKLDGFVNGLQEELKKIDAFKRQLPLCMLLLNDAILYLKSESLQCVASNNQPVFEAFTPLKKNFGDDDDCSSSLKKENESKDKKNWLSTVKLWNTDLNLESKATKKGNHWDANVDTFEARKGRSRARGLVPLKANSDEVAALGLSLLTPGIKMRDESSTVISPACISRAVSSSVPACRSNLQNGVQPPREQCSRKQRRCWSPDLHRLFVNALQQLGGSQAATPKQIRELMQVDGLTNDEVKSHLQKYRLHTRRAPSAAPDPASQTVAVSGGVSQMSQDQYGDKPKATSA